MPETKPVILKNSKIGYKLGEGDVDLQGMSMNPLESIERAKLKACEKINEITGLSVTLSDFRKHETMHAVAYLQSSTKRMAVEWDIVKEGSFKKEKGSWKIHMNIDHPAFQITERAGKQKLPNGPDRPHVGYKAEFFSSSGDGHRKTVGHIFVDDIATSRPSRDSFAAEPGRYNTPR